MAKRKRSSEEQPVEEPRRKAPALKGASKGASPAPLDEPAADDDLDDFGEIGEIDLAVATGSAFDAPRSPADADPAGLSPEALAREQSDLADLELWKRYKATGDPKIREHLILDYTPFVKYIAGRVAMNLPPNVCSDDLVSNGVFGLIDAIEKFELGRNVKFKTYAQTRIRGAILDNLRSADWVPRSVRTKAKQLERAYIDLEQRNGRPATDEEVARHLGITSTDLYKLFNETKNAFLVSLDEVIYGEDEKATRADVVYDENANPQKIAERKELKRMLVEAIKELSDRERLVLTLYYYEELTLKEIGAVLDVSDSRVSQLHTKAILKLRARLRRLIEE